MTYQVRLAQPGEVVESDWWLRDRHAPQGPWLVIDKNGVSRGSAATHEQAADLARKYADRDSSPQRERH